MVSSTPQDGSMLWLGYALLTVANWGLYGILLHSGQMNMNDPVMGRYKAFLFVGIAYFLTAVLAPLLVLFLNGSDWAFPVKGMSYSLIAGIVGAAGAFFVLMAFGAKGTPPVVMSIIFGGAPLVNAAVSIAIHPPAGGIGAIRWPFFLGIAMLATGGALVTLFKPPPGAPPAKTETQAVVTPQD
jgi:hypothetical protein